MQRGPSLFAPGIRCEARKIRGEGQRHPVLGAPCAVQAAHALTQAQPTTEPHGVAGLSPEDLTPGAGAPGATRSLHHVPGPPLARGLPHPLPAPRRAERAALPFALTGPRRLQLPVCYLLTLPPTSLLSVLASELTFILTGISSPSVQVDETLAALPAESFASPGSFRGAPE